MYDIGTRPKCGEHGNSGSAEPEPGPGTQNFINFQIFRFFIVWVKKLLTRDSVSKGQLRRISYELNGMGESHD